MWAASAVVRTSAGAAEGDGGLRLAAGLQQQRAPDPVEMKVPGKRHVKRHDQRQRSLGPALATLAGDPDPEKSGRVMKAMMTMGKIDVAKLQQAYEG